MAPFSRASGLCVLTFAYLSLGLLAACGGEDASARTAKSAAGGTGAGGTGAGGAGGSGAGGASTNGGAAGAATPQAGAGGAAGSGPNSASDPEAPLVTSCEAEGGCKAPERCLTGPDGTRCATSCAGQPCASGETSYCTRTGGVICVAQ